MSNKIFKAILDENIHFFKKSFSNTSKEIFYDEKTKKLIHPGEYGMYREDVVKDFLRLFIPGNLDIDDGFIITNDNSVSTQCDIIICDKSASPLIKTKNKQKFFPSETVVGIGEIKSTLSKNELATALNKLAKNKSLRKPLNFLNDKGFNNVVKCYKHTNVYDDLNPYNHIFSFLICKKLNFNLDKICEEIDSLYDDEIPIKYRHNIILSLDDGILLYSRNSKSIAYPTMGNYIHSSSYMKNQDGDEDANIKIFGHYLFNATMSATILCPDIVSYLKD
ncbi:MAG: DUF6602 domain-containing protein [Paraclostridium sordellii]